MKEKTLLYVVDDSDDYRLLIGQTFSRFLPQYDPRFFTSGTDLRAYVLGDLASNQRQPDLSRPDLSTPDLSRPDLILMDFHMPGLNGLETLTWLRQHSQWRVVPVVMMSNGASPEEADACLAAGARAFLRKPMHGAQLREILTMALTGDYQPQEP